MSEENEKLRDLLRDVCRAALSLCERWEGPCDRDFPSHKPPCPIGNDSGLCLYGRIAERMEELGIEV